MGHCSVRWSLCGVMAAHCVHGVSFQCESDRFQTGFPSSRGRESQCVSCVCGAGSGISCRDFAADGINMSEIHTVSVLMTRSDRDHTVAAVDVSQRCLFKSHLFFLLITINWYVNTDSI